MIRWRKAAIVAQFEFLSTVRRPGYLIATFGMPLFIAAYAALVALPAYVAERTREPIVHGIVDEAGALQLADEPGSASEARRGVTPLDGAGLEQMTSWIRPGGLELRSFGTEEEARAALEGGLISSYTVLREDYIEAGRLDVYAAAPGGRPGGEVHDVLRSVIRQRLLSGRLEPDVAARVLDPLGGLERFTVTAAGEVQDDGELAAMLRLAVPLLFMALFLLSILMTSGYLMQGTAVEKENKVVEVLLAAADPDEILAGKLLGLGGAGLLQMAVWSVLSLLTGLGILPLLWATGVEVPWTALVVGIPFFIAAFLFFGGLILGTSSLGSNMREAQQLAMVWSLLAAVPLLMIPVLVDDPHGTIARVLTWIPFTAGPTVVLRLSTGGALVTWWEVAGAFAVLLVSTWVALAIGARLFRIGMLSVGARPTLREIVRQARLAA